MDGDVAPLAEIAELAGRNNCRLMVDEAHATGCLGPGGRGSVAAAGLSDQVDVVMGTLGKALGNYGAYVCGSRELTEYLVNVCRPFIFSTALPPSVVLSARKQRGASYTLKLRLRVYPDRYTNPGGSIAVLDDEDREIEHLVLSHVAHAGPVVDRLVERIRNEHGPDEEDQA